MDINKSTKEISSKQNIVFDKKFDIQNVKNKISQEAIIEKIKTIFDPEIPVNIYDLGLIYNLDVDEKNNIYVKMTLTTPNCPVADSLPKQVGATIGSLNEVSSVKVELVWDPYWSTELMSEDAKLALDIS